MKTLQKITFIVLASIVTFSCSKDDDVFEEHEEITTPTNGESSNNNDDTTDYSTIIIENLRLERDGNDFRIKADYEGNEYPGQSVVVRLTEEDAEGIDNIQFETFDGTELPSENGTINVFIDAGSNPNPEEGIVYGLNILDFPGNAVAYRFIDQNGNSISEFSTQVELESGNGNDGSHSNVENEYFSYESEENLNIDNSNTEQYLGQYGFDVFNNYAEHTGLEIVYQSDDIAPNNLFRTILVKNKENQEFFFLQLNVNDWHQQGNSYSFTIDSLSDITEVGDEAEYTIEVILHHDLEEIYSNINFSLYLNLLIDSGDGIENYETNTVSISVD